MFGILVRQHRYRLALTQEELAVRAGITDRALRAIEAGARAGQQPSS
ncbi:MAG TPA: helix-turn-helix domain-containing protein [Micromonosporaceae bacterium]|nr:helix-turn-helix domain-containing protein [Micromonosporaceae bacterium]